MSRSVAANISGETVERSVLVARGRRLEYLTISWNSFEALVALVAGLTAGSIALVGFGLDSVIESASAGILLWALSARQDARRREQTERTARRWVGVTFLFLAASIAAESVHSLWTHSRPEQSWPGILITIAAVLVMPMLARAKRRVATQLGHGALQADSRQADFCAYLSAIVLAGLLLNRWLGWWWSDAAAGLMIVPTIAREGLRGLRGEACDDCRQLPR